MLCKNGLIGSNRSNEIRAKRKLSETKREREREKILTLISCSDFEISSSIRGWAMQNCKCMLLCVKMPHLSAFKYNRMFNLSKRSQNLLSSVSFVR